MGRSIKNTRRRIDTGCLDNGYRYHCWNCNQDLSSLSHSLQEPESVAKMQPGDILIGN